MDVSPTGGDAPPGDRTAFSETSRNDLHLNFLRIRLGSRTEILRRAGHPISFNMNRRRWGSQLYGHESMFRLPIQRGYNFPRRLDRRGYFHGRGQPLHPAGYLGVQKNTSQSRSNSVPS